MKATTTKQTASKNGKATQKNVVPKKSESTATQTKDVKKEERPKETLQTASTKVLDILKPNAKNRLSKLDTFNILADKFKAVSEKQDELTHFRAGNDDTNSQMKFSSASNYTFSIRNPQIISKILDIVEEEFSKVVEKAEKEVLEFNL